MAFSTARGWSSQAAAAISTLSVSLRSRPPAKACRNAASAKATPRPVCLAKVATRMAVSVLPGQGSGQRKGWRPYSAARRSHSAMPASRSAVSDHDPPPVWRQMPPSRIGCHSGTTGRTEFTRSAARYE